MSFLAACLPAHLPAELDMCVPSVPAKAVIQAFEGLRGALVRSGNEQHAVLMQEGWTALLGRALTGAVHCMLCLMAGGRGLPNHCFPTHCFPIHSFPVRCFPIHCVVA
jgi:hypothetical protein